MTGLVASQEAAKAIYPGNSTAPEFEQGVIPWAFIGTTVGNGTGSALSRTLCKTLVPNFMEWLTGTSPAK
ncbi:hypothetical protein CC86DRAFT_373023 [Ophiobolus disseminans]|uniref:Uncharacterized protein n=1 Tax=Ophiobolus disseminans TaxID=1469910 RepID=A0A6A6ZN74_9PLEO|nr:hypothetical protein CC86DRAFT_373023 [Ophiobolus disseminans]